MGETRISWRRGNVNYRLTGFFILDGVISTISTLCYTIATTNILIGGTRTSWFRGNVRTWVADLVMIGINSTITAISIVGCTIGAAKILMVGTRVSWCRGTIRSWFTLFIITLYNAITAIATSKATSINCSWLSAIVLLTTTICFLGHKSLRVVAFFID